MRRLTVMTSTIVIIVLITSWAWSGSAQTLPDPNAAQILVQFQQKEGFIPKPLQLMGHRMDMLPKFMVYGKGVLEGGPLNDKERWLVALSAAVALKSPDCIKAHSARARKAGVTEEQIIQTILIAGLISHTSPLQVAYEAAGYENKMQVKSP